MNGSGSRMATGNNVPAIFSAEAVHPDARPIGVPGLPLSGQFAESGAVSCKMRVRTD
jgi:hypothetical protein